MYLGNLGFDPITASIGLSIGGKLVKGIFGGGPPNPAKLRKKSDLLKQKAASLQSAGKQKKAAKKLAKSERKLQKAIEIERKSQPLPVTSQVLPPPSPPPPPDMVAMPVPDTAISPTIHISSGGGGPSFMPTETVSETKPAPNWLIPALGIGAALLLRS